MEHPVPMGNIRGPILWRWVLGGTLEHLEADALLLLYESAVWIRCFFFVLSYEYQPPVYS